MEAPGQLPSLPPPLNPALYGSNFHIRLSTFHCDKVIDDVISDVLYHNDVIGDDIITLNLGVV